MESTQFKFYKEDGKWYIYLPQWEGEKAALQMVAGADTMLDMMSENKDEISVVISTEKFGGAEELQFIGLADKEMGEGAYYVLDEYEGKIINLEMWLCAVTEFVLGGYPSSIFVKKRTCETIVIDKTLGGELVDLYHEERGLVESGINEHQFNDARCQMVEQGLSGYYIMWKDKKITIENDGNMSSFPVGLYDHINVYMARLFKADKKRHESTRI